MRKRITRRIVAVAVGCCLAAVMSAQTRYVGGDISLLPTYEEHNSNHLDASGNRIADVMQFMKDNGWNAMRVRLFVNPDNATSAAKGQGVRQSLDYVVALGKQIKAKGLKLMLDFHYSDTWADPLNQWTPKEWVGLSDAELYDKIEEYTRDALTTLVNEGATPDFIQIGNEISYGMMWGVSTQSTGSQRRCYTSSDNNWDYFTTLLKRAGKACRAVCPQARIIVHTERVPRVDALSNIYSRMNANGVDYDIIGLSYYPYYHGGLAALRTALERMESEQPGKDIMIVETGYFHKWQPDDVDNDFSATWPISDEGQRAFTEDLVKELDNHKKVTGLFWWFPEANEYGLNWETQRVTDGWYNAGLWDNETGRVLPALFELKQFLGESASVELSEADRKDEKVNVYTLDGKTVARGVRQGEWSEKQGERGLYVVGKKKVLKR